MGERIRADLPPGHALEPVVSDCGCCTQGAFDIPSLEEVALLRRFRPDTCEAISLQFHAYRQCVPGAGILTLQATHFAFDAEEVLHMMSEFVGENIRLRELARSSESALQLVVEAEIDVDLLIGGTIERSSGRLRRAASGRRERAPIWHAGTESRGLAESLPRSSGCRRAQKR